MPVLKVWSCNKRERRTVSLTEVTLASLESKVRETLHLQDPEAPVYFYLEDGTRITDDEGLEYYRNDTIIASQSASWLPEEECKGLETTTVVMDHKAAEEDELSLRVGDAVKVIRTDDSGWVTGIKDGKKGIFPRHCVQGCKAGAKEIKSTKELTTENKSVAVVPDPLNQLVDLANLANLASCFEELGKASEIPTGVQVIYNGGLIQDSLVVGHPVRRSGQERPRLIQSKWDEESRKFRTEKIGLIYLDHVEIDFNTFYAFLQKCENCKHFKFEEMIDENSKISRFSQVLKNMNRLLRLDIDSNVLGPNSGILFQSVNAPNLRVLYLGNNKMSGLGEALRQLLCKTSNLLWLSFGNNQMKGEEAIRVMQQLPLSCPHLLGMQIDNNDFSNSQNQLVSIFGSLKNLKVVTMAGCKLQTSILQEIVRCLTSKIECLAIERNDSASTFDSQVMDHFEKFEKLQFLRISSEQFKPSDLNRLKSRAEAKGTKLIVDVPSLIEMERFRAEMKKHCDECFTLI